MQDGVVASLTNVQTNRSGTNLYHEHEHDWTIGQNQRNTSQIVHIVLRICHQQQHKQ